jgi:transketolase
MTNAYQPTSDLVHGQWRSTRPPTEEKEAHRNRLGMRIASSSSAPGGTPEEDPDVVLISTGSELQLCVEAKKFLADKGTTATVVSMPCVAWFESQPVEYRETVLPPTVSARVAVEAAVAQS